MITGTMFRRKGIRFRGGRPRVVKVEMKLVVNDRNIPPRLSESNPCCGLHCNVFINHLHCSSILILACNILLESQE